MKINKLIRLYVKTYKLIRLYIKVGWTDESVYKDK
jgi:hypothetical protein